MDAFLLPAFCLCLPLSPDSFFLWRSVTLSLSLLTCFAVHSFVRSFVRSFVLCSHGRTNHTCYFIARCEMGRKRVFAMDGKKRRKDAGKGREAIVSPLSIISTLTQGPLCVCEVTPSKHTPRQKEKTNARRKSNHYTHAQRWNTVHCSLVLFCCAMDDGR